MENSEGKKVYYVKRDELDKKNEAKRMGNLKDQLEWIKRQIEYATFTDSYKLRMELHKGEIYEIDWGINVNAEFSNRHYGVVLRDSSEFDPLVLVCPIKTNKKGAHRLSDIDLGYILALNSEHRSVAVINQIKTIDKVRIFSRSAISENDLYVRNVPMLEPEKVKLILTAYSNFINGLSLI